MKYFRYMWVGPSLDDSRTEIFRRLKKHTLPEDVYVLALPKTDDRLMEIYDAETLNKQKYYKKSDQIVFAVAGSKDEAMELAGGILARVLKETGGYSIRTYLEQVIREVQHGR